MSAHPHASRYTFGIGRDREYFIENLSMLVASGMTILDALGAVAPGVRSGQMRRIIEGIREDIESGASLSQALAEARLFPSHVVSLIRIGEASGNLASNLRALSLEQRKERIFRSRIRSAMLYPVFVLALTLVIGTGIAWFILPKLATVFTQMHQQLPLITRVLIATGTFLQAHGAVAVPSFLVVVGLVLYVLFAAPKTKRIGQAMLFALPGVKRLIQEVEISRFGYLLGTLLSAGVPVLQSISSLADATASPYYRAFYESLAKSIEEGNSFQKSFASYRKLDRLIPNPIQQLIVSGERSGNLPKVLLEISQDYEDKSETTTKDLSTILEPILLVVVWLGVVSVALAVIMPIYSLVGNLNNGPAPYAQTN